eukprot:6214301-Pleurochrysis_carterae.AAC.2
MAPRRHAGKWGSVEELMQSTAAQSSLTATKSTKGRRNAMHIHTEALETLTRGANAALDVCR